MTCCNVFFLVDFALRFFLTARRAQRGADRAGAEAVLDDVDDDDEETARRAAGGGGGAGAGATHQVATRWLDVSSQYVKGPMLFDLVAVVPYEARERRGSLLAVVWRPSETAGRRGALGGWEGLCRSESGGTAGRDNHSDSTVTAQSGTPAQRGTSKGQTLQGRDTTSKGQPR